MSRPDSSVEEPMVARVVHKSALVDQAGSAAVIKLMLNLSPDGRAYAAGTDIAFLPPDYAGGEPGQALRRYTIESVGEVPFEDSVDLTIYVQIHDQSADHSVARYLDSLNQGDSVAVYGPFPYPFYPPMGSRSNMIMIGAGCGMAPFRWLAHKVHARKLDWMGKVLMLEGDETGLERHYLNEPGADQGEYFDAATYRAFEALKTRYSATAFDRGASRAANMEALWRLMGQGSVFVYLAGYRRVAEALDQAMTQHLRLTGRWHDAKATLRDTGHWLEYLYD